MSLENYKYVMEFDPAASISDELIRSLLEKTWKITPSKNNFMPYSVYVVGQGNQELKNEVYKLCLKSESKSNSIPNIESVRYQIIKPRYYNVVSCSYLLIFTQRVETKLNPWQEQSTKKGNVYEQTKESSLHMSYGSSLIEIGMFSNTFAAFCLQNNIDISHTMCFSKDIEDWKSIGVDINYPPIMLMTVGKGLIYRESIASPIEKLDFKPDFSRVVNFIK